MRRITFCLVLLFAACEPAPASPIEAPRLRAGLIEEGAASAADAAMFRIDGRGVSLCAPADDARTGLAIVGDRLWLADRCNRRTLGFGLPASTGDAADIVLQQPTFSTHSHRGLPETERVVPVAVAGDGAGRVYVGAEGGGVLVYEEPTADGQLASFTLEAVPDDIVAIRLLRLGVDAREVIAVVGASRVGFYPAGSAVPVSFWRLEENPCPGHLADVAALRGDGTSRGDTLLVACADTAHRCPAGPQLSPPPSYDAPSDACSAVYAMRIDTALDVNVFRFPRTDPFYGGVPVPAYALNHSVRGLAASEELDAVVIDDGGHRLLRFEGIRAHVDALFDQPPSSGFPVEAAGEASAAFAFGQENTSDRFPNRDAAGVGDVPGANTLRRPTGVLVDGEGGLWVADAGNHRVLRYPVVTGADEAALVLGQGGFAGRIENRLDAASSQALSGLAWTASGTLYVSDAASHRVLAVTDAASLPRHATADAVLGQDSFDTARPNGRGEPGLGADDLSSPRAVAVDPETGSLFVSDEGNGRILVYPAGATSPTAVIGAPDFETAGTSCFVFRSMAARFGTLYVAAAGRDNGTCRATPAAHRIFAYRLPHSASARALPDRVFGQNQSPDLEATPNLPNRGGVDALADTLHDVAGLFVDSERRLWVADRGNHRVLWFDEADGDDAFDAVIADGVVGQIDLQSNAPYGPDAGPSRHGFRGPEDLVVDEAGGLWVSFPEEHRVLHFPAPMDGPRPPPADKVLGQADFASTDPNRGRQYADLDTLHTPGAIALDARGRTLAVADAGNRRGLLYHQNRPPEVGAALTHTVHAGERLEVPLALSDPDGDAVESPSLGEVRPSGLVTAITLEAATLRFDAPADGADTTVAVDLEVRDVAPVPRTTRVTLEVDILPARVATDAGTPGDPGADGGADDRVDGGGASDGSRDDDASSDSCGGCATTDPRGALPWLSLILLALFRRRRPGR